MTRRKPPTLTAPGTLKDMTGSTNNEFGQALARDVVNALWLGRDEIRDQQINACLVALHAIRPQNETEGLLAAQMIATHAAAMECYRRAMLPEQTFAGRDMALRHAAKLSRLYADQVQVLAKLQGKGQQTVRVEHVTVNADKAIVGGTFNQAPSGTGAGASQKDEGQPHALAHAPGEAMPRALEAIREAVPRAGG